MKMLYTEKVHAKRLLGMLERNNPCLSCPASENFGKMISDKWTNKRLEGGAHGACAICVTFLGYSPFLPISPHSDFRCPCFYLDEKEALRRTWEALEEKGYI